VAIQRVFGTASAVAVIAGGVLSSVAAVAAPRELYNKTISISWAEHTMQKTPDGRTVTPTVMSERIVYVSSAGRVFVRGNRRVDNRRFSGGKQTEAAPGQGGAGTLAFQGNQLVGTAVFSGFARRLTVSFDSGFSSCTANVIYGKSGGPSTWTSFTGQTHEIISINVSGTSCSIRDGNAFAGQ